MSLSAGKKGVGLYRWIPGLILSIGAIFLLALRLDWHELIRSFSQIQVIPFFAATGLFILSLFTRSIAWRFFLKNEVSLRDAFLVENEGYLLNNLLPLRLGELGRAVIMGRISGRGAVHVLSTIVIERITDITLAAIFISLTFSRAVGKGALPLISWIVFGAVLIGMIGLVLVAFNHHKVQGFLDAHHFKSEFIEMKMKRGIKSFLAGLAVIKEGKYLIGGFTIMAFSWAIALMEYFVLMRIFLPEAPFWWTVLGLGSLALGVAIPSAPANIGVFEVALVGALALVGVSNHTATAYALVIHVTHFAVTCALGLIGLRIHGSSLSAIWRDLKQKPSVEDNEVQK